MAAPVPFIVGAPRSGTTLLRFMLEAHPALAIPPETGFFVGLAGMPEAARLTRDSFLDFVTHFPPDAPSWQDYGLEKDDLAAALARVMPFDLAGGLRCFFQLYAARHGKARWGDKTPLHALHIAAIARTLPEARIIHLIRDGRDAALSLRPLWFAPGKDAATLAAQWQHVVRTARAQSAKCPHYREVRYEDLLREPERELRALCEFLALPFHAGMLASHERAAGRLGEVRGRQRANGEVIITAAQRIAMQRRTCEPPDLSRIGVWRREMNAEDQRQFAEVAGPLLAALGYAD